jgi:hypothetical protein
LKKKSQDKICESSQDKEADGDGESDSGTKEEDDAVNNEWTLEDVAHELSEFIHKFQVEIDMALMGVDGNNKGPKQRGKSCNANKKLKTPCQCVLQCDLNWDHIFKLVDNVFLTCNTKKDYNELRAMLIELKILFWVPEVFFRKHVQHMPCPNSECRTKDNRVSFKGWCKVCR